MYTKWNLNAKTAQWRSYNDCSFGHLAPTRTRSMCAGVGRVSAEFRIWSGISRSDLFNLRAHDWNRAHVHVPYRSDLIIIEAESKKEGHEQRYGAGFRRFELIVPIHVFTSKRNSKTEVNEWHDELLFVPISLNPTKKATAPTQQRYRDPETISG